MNGALPTFPTPTASAHHVKPKPATATTTTQQNHDTATKTVPGAAFGAGDRVVVQGLTGTTAQDRNGRHGRVVAVAAKPLPNSTPNHYLATQVILYKIHLDSVLAPVQLMESNLQRESLSSCEPCPVYDGVVSPPDDPSHGMRIAQVFHVARWIAALELIDHGDQELKDCSKTIASSWQAVSKLPIVTRLRLNDHVLQHWTQSVYAKLQAALAKNTAFGALHDVQALASWHRGVCLDVWMVGRDGSGTYVVADANKERVFRMVGLARGGRPAYKTDHDTATMSLQHTPTKVRVTMVPWYGRLLYDSTVLPPAVPAPSPIAAHQLHTVVLRAIQSQSVVSQFVELNGSRNDMNGKE